MWFGELIDEGGFKDDDDEHHHKVHLKVVQLNNLHSMGTCSS
jgi:hypothetical protein